MEAEGEERKMKARAFLILSLVSSYVVEGRLDSFFGSREKSDREQNGEIDNTGRPLAAPCLRLQ